MFHRDLIWAGRASRFYISTGILDAAKDNQLIQEAMSHLKVDNIEQSKHLLNESIQINPYTQARLLLGLCYLKQGDDDKMLECYNEYRRIDPSFVSSYMQMIMVLEKQKDIDAINRLLGEGIEHFRRQVELYRPHLNPDVPEHFNAKASNVYNKLCQSLKLLEDMQHKYDNK
jgi:tetratricopeptide (TPR) repeat protein